MLDMTQAMKQIAEDFRTQFDKDAQLVDQVGVRQDECQRRTDKEMQNIKATSRSVVVGF